MIANCRRSTLFEVGKKPSGDVFSSSPKTSPRKLANAVPAKTGFLAAQIAESPLKTAEERGMTRCVTTGSTPVLDTTPSGRYIQAKSHHQIGGIDVQDLYPPSSCIFVAK